MRTRSGPDEQRLRELFVAHADQVLRYAMRHTDRTSAHDAVSETFLIAWRRIADVPERALPWLLVTARNVIRNRQRTISRQSRLATELAALALATTTAAPTPEDIAVERADVLDALGTLTADQREALLLVAWDGLTTAEAASVAGCSRSAFDMRLNRARSRLRAAAPHHDPPDARACTELATPRGAGR